MTMDFASFWTVNQGAYLDNALAFAVRYQGTLADYVEQQSLIEGFCLANFERHKADLVTMTVVEGDGNFTVYAIGHVR